jgi:D-xylose transport system ATP-binding protein
VAALPLLTLRNITKDFPGLRALDDVSFDLVPGEIHAIVGENGAGKSTFIKILGGVYSYQEYSGEFLINGTPVRFQSVRDAESAGIAVIHQELMLVNELTVAENIFLGHEPSRNGMVQWNRLHSDAQKLLDSFGLSVDRNSLVASLSIATKQLVEIVRALRKESRILILDEPTAALSDHEAEVLFTALRRLRDQGCAIIYISHRLDEIFAIADRITVFRDGRECGTAPAVEWTKNKVVSTMVGRELRELFPYTKPRIGPVAMEVQNLSVTKNGKEILHNISFHVSKGEIVGLAGLLGAGRTELCTTLFGSSPGDVDDGKILISGKEVMIASPLDAIRSGISLVPEDRKNTGLVMSSSILENLSLVHLDKFVTGGFINEADEHKACHTIAADVGMKASALTMPVASLSGGNQQKIVIGKWLMERPAILILDEPTRGIDVGAKSEIYVLINRLKTEGAAILFSSSELPELLGICDRILVIKRGSISGEFSRSEATQEKIMECAA